MFHTTAKKQIYEFMLFNLVEKQSAQIESLVDNSRGKDRVESEVMKLQDDIVILKETTSIQPVIAKRHQSGTLNYQI